MAGRVSWTWVRLCGRSLPPECRQEKFDKKTLPDQYRPFVRPENAGGLWTTVALNMTGLPQTITWELAWLLHREIELGRTIYPHRFNGMVRAMRAATSSGTRAGREARSLLSLGVDQWVREVQAARLRDHTVTPRDAVLFREYVKRLQDVLCYAYQTGAWWRLDVWNPVLDCRIPQRAHEPQGRSVANFSHLTSDWLREAAKWWLSQNLATERYAWTTIKSRLDGLKWLQRLIDEVGDHGPTLVADVDDLRGFFHRYAEALRTHVVQHGRTKGQLLSKVRRAQSMVVVEQFYRWMFDNRHEAARVLGELRWLQLHAAHTAPFRAEDKPRQRNLPPTDKVLEDRVMSEISAGAELLAQPKAEGGLGDLQAFHALALLLRTGRRVNEILMMDFEPLLPLIGSPDQDDRVEGGFVARLRYQQTKIVTGAPTIPVDAEIVSIVRAQQATAREILRANDVDADPKYLFIRTRQNRLGSHPYSATTLHSRLSALARALDIRDSVGRPVAVSQTHQFRHTRATSLLNAGVPLHVVMRYFGHTSPTMTMHYARTLSETAESEFLRFRKVTADGRELTIAPSDLFDMLHLSQRADRVLPNGWCMLPPKQSCDRGNACLSCGMFATDESHRGELERQLVQTTHLIEQRRAAFEDRYGTPMPADNVWLASRCKEQGALQKVLIALDEVKVRPGAAVRGAGTPDNAETA
jgi:integrase